MECIHIMYNPMEQSGWFQFANGRDYGYANGDGTLNTSGFYYDPWGRIVYCHWNGMVARGLITDGTTYYNMDMTDGHLIGVFPANTEVKAHEHHWEAVNLTVRHPEQKCWTDQGHRETVLIKEAHEEPNMVVKWICKTCYFRDGIIVELPRDKEPSQDETYQQHFQYHWDRNDGLVQWGDVEVQDGMKWVPAMYTEEWIQNIVPVVYKEAKDEVITLYYKCSECGAVK
ncbi:hypothetical protein [Roseburia sp. 499]|uniref:hypothetical protein n=1 Tax=Roseburia sp. 499 TaxID=1261634 RepID=UPI0009636465|nr:hypothetical protein [Roseburia sp. 499]WVK70961.1 hypothetical protein BIV20_05345 [Roseburia sp. 499]